MSRGLRESLGGPTGGRGQGVAFVLGLQQTDQRLETGGLAGAGSVLVRMLTGWFRAVRSAAQAWVRSSRPASVRFSKLRWYSSPVISQIN
jgi:hypothetical protein